MLFVQKKYTRYNNSCDIVITIWIKYGVVMTTLSTLALRTTNKVRQFC